MERTLKLTHDEINMITKSLELMYGTKIEVSNKNRFLLEKDVINSIVKDANKFDDLSRKIRNGNLDV